MLNGDDERVRRIGRAHRGRVVWFGRDRAFEVSAERWRGPSTACASTCASAARAVDVALPLRRAALPHELPGRGAVAHLRPLGAGRSRAARRLRPRRIAARCCACAAGVTLLDDCYNSNPAVEAAVTALGLSAARPARGFLGDMLELGPTGPELHRETGGGWPASWTCWWRSARWPQLPGGRARGGPRPSDSSRSPTRRGGRGPVDLVRPGDAVLVKGSRGVRLEAVVDALRGALRAAGALMLFHLLYALVTSSRGSTSSATSPSARRWPA